MLRGLWWRWSLDDSDCVEWVMNWSGCRDEDVAGEGENDESEVVLN